MSKIDRAQWQSPFTPNGLRVPWDAARETFQIHEAGTMVLHEGWLHRGVCSPFWRLFYDFSPGAWVQFAGKRHTLERERVILMPDNVAFDCGSRAGVEHMWLHFSWQLTTPPDVPGIIDTTADGTFQAVAMSLRDAIKAEDVDGARHLGTALLHVTFSQLDRSWFANPSARLQRVMTWMEHNLGASITNDKLAAQAGFGVEAFIRWFKVRTGRTPAAYVAERRVREACRRLAFSEDSIEHIAESMGFSNRHHFSRVFKRYAGCGPATFRRGQDPR